MDVPEVSTDDPGARADGEPEARWVDTPEGLRDVLDAIAAEPVWGIDTEFHRERTYFAHLALVQVAWPTGLALIDPLAVDVAPLGDVLRGSGLVVMHAGGQDLEVLERSCGSAPTRLFDTQIAAGFLGYGTPSLAALVAGEIGVVLPKGDRLTDWLRRPLDPAQRSYAASDVAHLLDLHRILSERLEAEGRLQWALDECEELRRRPRLDRHPDDAWMRIKEVRQLRGSARGVARAVAAWRERRAAELDIPVRHVLSDLGVIGVAQRAPTTADQLRSVRGVDGRHLRNGATTELLEAVAAGRTAPQPPPREGAPPELDRDLRPAVGLISTWISQLSRDLRLETSLLATRNDIERLLAADEGRLTEGWRADLLGEPIRRLVEGEAALAFAGRGRLVLEARSGEPLGPTAAGE